MIGALPSSAYNMANAVNLPNPSGGNSDGSGWFGDLVSGVFDGALDVGKFWLSSEIQKDTLKDQLEIQTLQNQLQASQQQAANGSQSTGGNKPPFDWKPWAIGGAALVGVIVIAKVL